MDDDVHLGLVRGDHGATDGLTFGADPLEMLLEGARCGAGAGEVAGLDVEAQGLHRQSRPFPERCW